jgi:Protein of unknown function (DUF4058)
VARLLVWKVLRRKIAERGVPPSRCRRQSRRHRRRIAARPAGPATSPAPEPCCEKCGLIDQCYEPGRYHARVDYRQEPEPALSAADTRWADELLRGLDLRKV